MKLPRRLGTVAACAAGSVVLLGAVLTAALSPQSVVDTVAVPLNAPSSAPSSPTLLALDSLPIKGRAPKTGYTRGQFGPAWFDADGNRCDQRNDVLRRDLTDPRPASGCTVMSGVLHDKYTGKVINFTYGRGTSSKVQVDHIVSLSNAWQTGASLPSYPEKSREALATDLDNLIATDGRTNQVKGDADAATWLPPVKEYRCTYVNQQIKVKQRYHLWVTQAEHDAMVRVLDTCPPVVATPVKR